MEILVFLLGFSIISYHFLFALILMVNQSELVCAHYGFHLSFQAAVSEKPLSLIAIGVPEQNNI